MKRVMVISVAYINNVEIYVHFGEREHRQTDVRIDRQTAKFINIFQPCSKVLKSPLLVRVFKISFFILVNIQK